MRDIEALGREPMGKLLLRLSAPSVVGMMVQSLYNVVDAFFVGRGVGPHGIAAVFVAFPLQIAVMAFAMLLGSGGVSVISRSLGANDVDRARRALGTIMSASLTLGLAAAVINVLLAEHLVRFLGASEPIAPDSVRYIRIVALSSPLFSYSIVCHNAARGEGNARVAMVTMLLSGLLNVFLDALFIFGLGMGVAGAAWATAASQIMGALWLTRYYAGGRSALTPGMPSLRPDWHVLAEVVRVGLSAFMNQIGVALTIGFLNNTFARYGGDAGMAAYGIIQRTNSLIVMPIFGLNQGMVPVVGYNWGAGKLGRVWQALKLSALTATGVCCLGAGILFFFPDRVFEIFSDDPELIARGVAGARFIASGIVFAGFQIVCSGFYQGIGRGIPSLCFSVLRQFVLIIPLVWGLSRLFGLKGAWCAFPITDTISFSLAFSYFWWNGRHLLALRSQRAPGNKL